VSNAAAASAAKPQPNPAPANPPGKSADEIKKILPGPISALLANEWKARESGVYFNTHEVVPPAGTPIENLLKREFWANVSQKFRRNDTIIACPRDGAWSAELVVWDAGQNWANVGFKWREMRPDFEAVGAADHDFEVFQDTLDGIIVRVKSTKQTVNGPFPNYEDAQRFIREHQRILKR